MQTPRWSEGDSDAQSQVKWRLHRHVILSHRTADQASKVLFGHLDDAVLSDGDMPTREGLHGADAPWRLQANPISFEVHRVSEALALAFA